MAAREAKELINMCQARAHKLVKDLMGPTQAPDDHLDWQESVLEKMRKANTTAPSRQIEEFHHEILQFQEEGNTASPLLTWWKENSSRYPLLSQVARQVLCVPASSATSERTFSVSGLIVTPLRNGLDPNTAQILTKLSFNKKLF